MLDQDKFVKHLNSLDHTKLVPFVRENRTNIFLIDKNHKDYDLLLDNAIMSFSNYLIKNDFLDVDKLIKNINRFKLCVDSLVKSTNSIDYLADKITDISSELLSYMLTAQPFSTYVYYKDIIDNDKTLFDTLIARLKSVTLREKRAITTDQARFFLKSEPIKKLVLNKELSLCTFSDCGVFEEIIAGDLDYLNALSDLSSDVKLDVYRFFQLIAYDPTPYMFLLYKYNGSKYRLSGLPFFYDVTETMINNLLGCAQNKGDVINLFDDLLILKKKRPIQFDVQKAFSLFLSHCDSFSRIGVNAFIKEFFYKPFFDISINDVLKMSSDERNSLLLCIDVENKAPNWFFELSCDALLLYTSSYERLEFVLKQHNQFKNIDDTCLMSLLLKHPQRFSRFLNIPYLFDDRSRSLLLVSKNPEFICYIKPEFLSGAVILSALKRKPVLILQIKQHCAHKEIFAPFLSLYDSMTLIAKNLSLKPIDVFSEELKKNHIGEAMKLMDIELDL